MLKDLRVDMVIVSPTESTTVVALWNGNGGLQEVLRPIFSKEGYVVYQVSSAAIGVPSQNEFQFD